MKQMEVKETEKKKVGLFRRFFSRFNPWLFLVCLLMAVVIWCASMYIEDPNGLREPAAETVACASTLRSL